jgi:hypothetical protein
MKFAVNNEFHNMSLFGDKWGLMLQVFGFASKHYFIAKSFLHYCFTFNCHLTNLTTLELCLLLTYLKRKWEICSGQPCLPVKNIALFSEIVQGFRKIAKCQ